MLKTLTRGYKMNARLHTFVSKVITPVVLLAGLLVLVLVHFKGTLAVVKSQDDLFRGERAFSIGNMGFTYQVNAGTDRPAILFGELKTLSYVDWNSTVSIDGHVENLWDNFHGYDYDRNDPNTRQFFSTTTGTGWQVVEVVTVVNAHTVTVQYSFVARTQGVAEPHHVVLSIAHMHQSWYQPIVQGNTFTAGVLPGIFTNPTSANTPKSVGTLTLSMSGPSVEPGAITVDDLQGAVSANGKQQAVATSFTTTYVIENPQVNRLTPLGTETITFSSAVPAGTPLPAVVPTP